jgi:hypothetical protein
MTFRVTGRSVNIIKTAICDGVVSEANSFHPSGNVTKLIFLQVNWGVL